MTATSNTVGAITSGKPANSVVPVITGTAKRGVALAAGPGTWSPTP